MRHTQDRNAEADSCQNIEEFPIFQNFPMSDQKNEQLKALQSNTVVGKCTHSSSHIQHKSQCHKNTVSTGLFLLLHHI